LPPLLHDAAEDHGGLPRLKDIESNFGSEVARMVAGLSDSLVENAGLETEIRFPVKLAPKFFVCFKPFTLG